MRTNEVPTGGLLEGVKVLGMPKSVGSSIALGLLAEYGATVVKSELPGGDGLRGLKYAHNQENRNMLAMAFNMRKPGGMDLFTDLIKWADIWLEASKGDMLDKFGITDEMLWEINPKLTIIHISGFGHTGEPDYVNRVCYDAIGQALGGFMYINGLPEPNPPLRAPNICDEITAMFGVITALTGLYNAQRTGKGESFDVAQFELMTRTQLNYPMKYLNDGELFDRTGNEDPNFQGYGAWKCKDGNWVFIAVSGANIIQRAKGFFGLGDDPDFPDGLVLALRGTPAGIKIDKAIAEYCDTHSADEVEAEMRKMDVPCGQILNLSQMEKNPHFVAREVFTEWEDYEFGKVKGVNIVPNAKVKKAKIWRGAPLLAHDTKDILEELGYSAEKIAELEESKTVQIRKED